MSNELIAWVVAAGLGAVVVVVGLRRDLSETTRSNLPRFDGDSESGTATVGLWEGEQRGGKPLSPLQSRLLALLYLLLTLSNATRVVLSPDDRLLHAAGAAVFAFAAGMLMWKASRLPPGAPNRMPLKD